MKTKRWDQQSTIIEKVRQKAYTVNIDKTRHLQNRRFICPYVIGDPETPFRNLVPQRQCQQTRQVTKWYQSSKETEMAVWLFLGRFGHIHATGSPSVS